MAEVKYDANGNRYGYVDDQGVFHPDSTIIGAEQPPTRVMGLVDLFFQNPVIVLLGLFVVLSFGALFAVHMLLQLPRSVLWTIAGVAGVGILYVAIKLAHAISRSFARNPVPTIIGLAIAVGVVAWAGTGIYRVFHNPNRPAAIKVSDLANSIEKTEADGVVLLQLFALPGRWSTAAVMPAAFKGVQMRAGGAIRVSVNGSEVSGGHYQPKPGDSIRFESATNRIVPIGIRVFLRQPTSSDAHSPVTLPVLAGK